MDAISYTEARSQLAKTIDRVCENHEPIIVTKRRDRAVVIMSLADYEALRETALLLRSPRNARRLLESIQELEERRGQERELLE